MLVSLIKQTAGRLRIFGAGVQIEDALSRLDAGGKLGQWCARWRILSIRTATSGGRVTARSFR